MTAFVETNVVGDLDYLVEKIVSILVENSNVYFGQNFEGSVVCCSKDQLSEDVETLIQESISVENMGNSLLNKIVIYSVKREVEKIENKYSSSWARKKAKLQLIEKLSQNGLSNIKNEVLGP